MTPEARDAVAAAKDRASLLGRNYVGTEHLLLGLLTVPSPAARIADSLGARRDLVEGEIVRIIGTGARVDDATRAAIRVRRVEGEIERAGERVLE